MARTNFQQRRNNQQQPRVAMPTPTVQPAAEAPVPLELPVTVVADPEPEIPVVPLAPDEPDEPVETPQEAATTREVLEETAEYRRQNGMSNLTSDLDSEARRQNLL